MAIGIRKNAARYRVRKHSPNNTALPMTRAATPPVTPVGASSGTSPSAGSGGLSRVSARNKHYNDSKKSNIKKFVGNPDTPYDHNVSENNISKPATVATRLSNSRFAQRNTISTHANKQIWSNGRMTHCSG